LNRAALLGALIPSLCLAQAGPARRPPPAATASVQDRLGEARALHQKGSAAEARAVFESLLPELRKQPDQADLALALKSLGEIALREGDYQRAADLSRQAADAYRAAGDETTRIRAVNTIGLAHLYRGDYPSALGYFEEALAFARANGQPQAEVEELNNVGNVHYYQARYLDAQQAFHDALELVDHARSAPWAARRRRITLSNQAVLYQRLGLEQQAIEVYQQLRSSPESLALSEQGRVLSNLGALYRRLDDPIKAQETYDAAKELFRREKHLDGEIGVLKNIGIVRALGLGDFDGAVESFTAALELAHDSKDRREEMQARLHRGKALYRKQELDLARGDFNAALALAIDLGTTEEQWKALYGLALVDHNKGHDELAAQRLRQALTVLESVRSKVELSKKTDFLADKRDVYDDLIELRAGQAAPEEIFDLMERSRARTFQDRLEERKSGAPSLSLPPRLAAVRDALDPSTLLLEFWITPRAALALWVTRDGDGVAALPDAGAALAELPKLLDALSRPPAKTRLSGRAGIEGAPADDGWIGSSERLGKLLLPAAIPFADDRLRHLIIVPDGALASVPFEVLPHPTAGGALLVERYDVSYLPSAAMLLRPPPKGVSLRFPWTRELLAFGDPLISSRPGTVVSDDPPRTLPTSAQEVRSIARMTHGRAELYLGASDLKKPLLEGRAAGVPLLHLSTHATADETNPEGSRILFSPETSEEPVDYLFLKQIYDLDLRGVDLATLSACDTERGKNVRGEGLQGFSRALLSAGARSAITTLWGVADQPTTELMQQLYFELNNGEPKAEALRRAKLKFLRSGGALAHPRYWAAFVLNGEGLRPIPRVFSWSSVLLFAATVVFFAVASVGRRRQRKRPRIAVVV
jgi:tetratricopeptide (TPR) repeat protein